MTLADSIRHTASIARWVASRLIAALRDSGLGRGAARLRLAQALAGLGRLEVARLVQLAHFEDRVRTLPHRRGEAARPFQRLFAVADLAQRVASDQLLGLGERAVDDVASAVA